MKYALVEVERFPELVEPAKLYWSEEFKLTAHRCACGCGDIIYLPIGPADYSLTSSHLGPTLRPSIGNWNVCNAHYWIIEGEVRWADTWSQEQISASRRSEDARRAAYYAPRRRSLVTTLVRCMRRFLSLIGLGRD